MRRLTAEWVRKAEADKQVAEMLVKSKNRLNDAICFHCQQLTEKYLKALIQELGLAVPRIHDLEELLDRLLPHDATLRPLRRGLNRMTEYAVDYRYPGLRATTRQVQSALRIANRVRQAIRKRLGLDKRRPRRKASP